jgi:hypothetical protein
MENKESPKPEGGSFSLKSKVTGFSNRLFGITKFILGLCLLPFVYSVSVSFLNEFSLVPLQLQDYFWSGVITLLIVYLFIWEPVVIYTKGQKILELVFTFFKPLVRVAPYLLPIYTIILLVGYSIFFAMTRSAELIDSFIFLFGLTMALHLIFSAKSIRGKKEDFLKANYIFGFSLIYIINLLILGFVFGIIFEKFSFVNLCNQAFLIAKGFFVAVFNQLFWHN